MELKEMIAVMQAAENGEKIQLKRKSDSLDRWADTITPGWDWYNFEYRVKPKEPRVFYIAIPNKYNTLRGGCAELVSKEAYEATYFTNYPWDYIKVVEELS